MTRVLVTGGLGFIGSRLCRVLLDEGLGVRCVDSLGGAYAPGTGPAAAPALEDRGAEVIVAEAGPQHVEGMDAVVHLAALPGVRSKRPAHELRAVNAELSGALASAAARAGARFVFTSSSSVYGNASELPTPEHAPLSPLNPYAESKVAAEAAVLTGGGDPVIVRPFSVYGAGQRPDMAFSRWARALDAGEPVPWHAPPGSARDFTYVDDVAAGILAALRRGQAGRTYNLSGWRAVDVREAFEVLARGRRAHVQELPSGAAEAIVTNGCGRKAAAELGYEPSVELEAGLGRQLADAATRDRLAA